MVKHNTRGEKDKRAKVESLTKTYRMAPIVDPRTGKLTEVSKYQMFHTGHIKRHKNT